MANVVFDIANLITPSVKDRLVKCKSIEEQIRFLFDLTDFRANFQDLADEIENNYQVKTGEAYEEVVITSDNQELLQEYGKAFPSFKEIKRLINLICDEERSEEACIDASEKLKKYYKEKQAENLQKTQVIEAESDTSKKKDNLTHTSERLGIFKRYAKFMGKNKGK